MGLPMWREPDEGDADLPGAKLDRAAAARRSTIRREATVRPSRISRAQNWSGTNQQHAEQRDRLLQRTRMSLERDRRQIEHLEAELERLRRNRVRARAQLELHDENEMMPEAPMRADAPESNIRETPLPPPLEAQLSPARESPLRFVEARHSDLSNNGSTSPPRHRSSRRPYMPSPPYSQDSRLSPDGPLRVAEGRVELTPNFAPARGPYQRAPGPSVGMARIIIEHGPPSDDEAPALETPPPEEWDAAYLSLRRVGRLSPRPRGLNVDGLGDRRRSLTPGSADSREEDTWEVLLTTMDQNGPASTAQNSFSSNRSDSAAQSNRSSQTAATSFGEIGQLDDTCDLDLPQGITEEHVHELRARHQRNERLAHENLGTVQDVSRNLDIIERRTNELTMFQNILGRMQRREDVPAEWWAAVGLSPVVWENVRETERQIAAEEERANA